VVKHHIAHGGVSRYDKIKHYHQVFLGIQISDKELELWCDRFSELVVQQVIDAPFVKGAEQAILEMGKKYSLFIISGTPQVEMDYIVIKLGLKSSFKAVCGSPKKKEKWSKELMDKYRFHPREVVFVGDAKTDFDAADFCRMHFVLRSHEENEAQFSSINCKKIKDLSELAEAIIPFNAPRR
ncbi:MAG: HAD family hydrolase, partial [Bacteroidetes bacterium]|nr:HAD family hydrolase [Bacteroidota bacterium]